MSGHRAVRSCFCQDLVQRLSADTQATDQEALGLVWRVAGDEESEYEETSEDESLAPSEEEEQAANRENKTLPEGRAEVGWIDRLRSGQSTQPIDLPKMEELRVLDRTLAAGDIVASVADPLGQTAVVTRVERVLDVELSNGSTLHRVPINLLRPVNPYLPGEAVLHKGSAGKLLSVKERVTVRLADGEIIHVGFPEANEMVHPANPAEYMFCEAGACIYYPGQDVRVRFAPPPRGPEPKPVKGTVLDVQVTHLYVEWVTSITGGLAPIQHPERRVPASASQVLRDESAQLRHWHLGSRGIWLGEDPAADASPQHRNDGSAAEQCTSSSGPEGSDGASQETPLLPAPERTRSYADVAKAAPGPPSDAAHPAQLDEERQGDGAAVGQMETASSQELATTPPGGWAFKLASRLLGPSPSILGKRKTRRRPRRNRAWTEAGVSKTALVIRTHTSADVIWQDGRVETGIPSATLLPREHLDDHDFWPDEFVQLAPDDLQTDTDGSKVGVIRSCDPRARTATVSWLRTGPDGFLQPLQDDSQVEITPVYKLEAHSDYGHLVGDLVMCLDVGEAEGDMMTNVGIVLGAKHGLLHLRMTDLTERRVTPDRVTGVLGGDDDGEETSEAEDDSEGFEEEGSWVTVADDDEAADDPNATSDELPPACMESQESDTPANESQPQPSTASSADNLPDVSPPSDPLPVTRTPKNLSLTGNSGGAPASLGSSPDGEAAITYGSFESTELSEICRAAQAANRSPAPAPAGNGMWGAANRFIGVMINGWSAPSEASTKPKSEAQQTEGGSGEAFPRFAVLEECPADHAYRQKGGHVGKKFQRAVLKEWKLLEDSLPNSIWVRAYETRMDLMRFAILGAADTPYAGHLFFFDIQMPPDYPAVPPNVHYCSWGLRVNPNLYENGKVCLSLLGTWTGNKNEMWSSESTLLQVVVSIQGLILVPKPYFNEAGFERQSGSLEGEQNAVLYNEQAFLLTVRSSIYLLSKPLAGFEDFIRDWYKRQRPALEGVCTSIISSPGAPLPYNMASQELEEPPKASAGFRIMLTEIYPRLLAALDKL